MKENLKHLKPIQNMMVVVVALLVLLFILTAQTSAIAQLFAPVPQTGQTQSYAAGDDGDLQMGVQWPGLRFTDNSDGTVTDNLTGLIWLKNADCFGERNWNDALDVSNNLEDKLCGLSDGSSPGDWRLSNVRELRSLIDHGQYRPPLPTGHPFANVQRVNYWSSTTVANRIDEAWLVVLGFVGILGFRLVKCGPAVRTLPNMYGQCAQCSLAFILSLGPYLCLPYWATIEEWLEAGLYIMTGSAMVLMVGWLSKSMLITLGPTLKDTQELGR